MSKKSAGAGPAVDESALGLDKMDGPLPNVGDGPLPDRAVAVLREADRAIQAMAGAGHHPLYHYLREAAARLAPVDAFYVGFYAEGRRVTFPYSFDGREYDDPSSIPYGEGGLSAWLLEHRRPYWSRQDGGRLLQAGQSFGDAGRISGEAIVVPVCEPAAPSRESGDRRRVLGMVSMQCYAPGCYDADTVRAFQWLADSLARVLAREAEDERRRTELGGVAPPASPPPPAAVEAFAARLERLRRRVEAVRRLVPAGEGALRAAVESLRDECERSQTETTEMLVCLALGGEDPLSLLTERQREVARLVGLGLTNREIAGRLCVSEQTVKSHVSAVRERFKVTGRAGVAEIVRRVLPSP